MAEGARLAAWSRAVRASTLKRLEAVPRGWQAWRPTVEVLSFADLAHHLVEADLWLERKVREPALPGMVGRVGEGPEDLPGYSRLLTELRESGERRAGWLEGLADAWLESPVTDDRFGGEVSWWWVIVRGNLDHEAHHRGQLATYLRLLATVREDE